jgi:hypothetical protein
MFGTDFSVLSYFQMYTISVSWKLCWKFKMDWLKHFLAKDEIEWEEYGILLSLIVYSIPRITRIFLHDFKISLCMSWLIKKHEKCHYKCILWYFLACIFKNSENLIYAFVAETDIKQSLRGKYGQWWLFSH